MKKSRDSRFLKKILTDTEIGFVNLSKNPDTALWSFWSCKEAAYKVVKKHDNENSFLPCRWQVDIDLSKTEHPVPTANGNNGGRVHQPEISYRKGKVIIPGKEAVYVRLFSHPSYVHCLGADSLATLDNLSWGIDILPQGEDRQNGNSSLFARQCLIRSLAGYFHLNEGDVEIRRIKNEGELQPPCVFVSGREKAVDVSLSHDGKFIAYAFNETS